MTLGTFFKSPPIKSGVIAGGIGLTIGMSGSFAIALKLSSYCSAAVDEFLDTLKQNITISELTATIDIKGHSTQLTLTDINAVLPDGVSHIMTHLNDVPDYCFSAPFAIGVCITLAASLALASCVATSVSTYAQKDEKYEHDYDLLANEV